MRGYLIPLMAGLVLAASAFMPWVNVGDLSLRGFPDLTALWVMGLGLLAAVLAVLSMITRKNSRHPLLLVGLVAFGIMLLSWEVVPQSVAKRVLTRSQAIAIVERTPMGEGPRAFAGSGIYAGLVASSIITGFGLTIVVRRVARPYVEVDPNDDV